MSWEAPIIDGAVKMRLGPSFSNQGPSIEASASLSSGLGNVSFSSSSPVIVAFLSVSIFASIDDPKRLLSPFSGCVSMVLPNKSSIGGAPPPCMATNPLGPLQVSLGA
jgi:hypothetical protein